MMSETLRSVSREVPMTPPLGDRPEHGPILYRGRLQPGLKGRDRTLIASVRQGVDDAATFLIGGDRGWLQRLRLSVS
jgi:hypothetical protein